MAASGNHENVEDSEDTVTVTESQDYEGGEVDTKSRRGSLVEA